MSHGHEFTVYSYTPDELKGVPTGVEVRDAREIMPEEKLCAIFRHRRGRARREFLPLLS